MYAYVFSKSDKSPRNEMKGAIVHKWNAGALVSIEWKIKGNQMRRGLVGQIVKEELGGSHTFTKFIQMEIFIIN